MCPIGSDRSLIINFFFYFTEWHDRAEERDSQVYKTNGCLQNSFVLGTSRPGTNEWERCVSGCWLRLAGWQTQLWMLCIVYAFMIIAEVIKNSFSYQEDQINILLLLVVTCATLHNCAQVLDMHMHMHFWIILKKIKLSWNCAVKAHIRSLTMEFNFWHIKWRIKWRIKWHIIPRLIFQRRISIE